MLIALCIGVFLCGCLVVGGIAVWWMPILIIQRLILSILLLCAGVAFGAIGIEIIIEDYF